MLAGDKKELLAALTALGIKNVNPDNIDFYINKLAKLREEKTVNIMLIFLLGIALNRL